MNSLDEYNSEQIEQVAKLLMDILKADLLGIYVYGSYILGGLQRYSDIDILAVSNRQTSPSEKQNLIDMLINISGVYQSEERRPLEVTIVDVNEIKPWKFPPKFDFKYGDWLRAQFESGKLTPWESNNSPDLAIVLTQVQLASKTVYGPPPIDLIPPIPYHDFMKAMTKEIESLLNDLDWDTRNVLLTLARMWFTVKTEAISSKQNAANWAIQALPNEFKAVIQHAINTANGYENENWENFGQLVRQCANYMNKQISEISSDYQKINTLDRKIKISN